MKVAAPDMGLQPEINRLTIIPLQNRRKIQRANNNFVIFQKKFLAKNKQKY